MLKYIHVFGILSANRTARTYQTYCTYAAGEPEGKTDGFAQKVWAHQTLLLCCGADPGGSSLEMVKLLKFISFWPFGSGKGRVGKLI